MGEGPGKIDHAAAVAAMPTGVLVVDPEGTVRALNPAGARILELDDDAVGQRLETLRPGLAAMMWPVDRGDLRLPAGAGGARQRVVGYSTRDMQDAEGRRVGTVAVFSDITRELDRQLAQEHQRRLADIGAVVASVAHEIRNPVYAIGSLLHLARQEAREHDDPELLLLLEKIAAENRRVGRMVQDLLHFGRARALAKEETDVIDLVRTIMEDVRSTEQLGEGMEPVPMRLELPFERRSGLRWPLDVELMRQVLVNLLRNATRAVRDRVGRGEEQGVVLRLDLRPGPAPELLIEIADEGVGMPPDVRERAFDPFFTTRADGTGLGLAVVERLVRKHGGSVSIDSDPGVGTSVVIRLPASRT